MPPAADELRRSEKRHGQVVAAVTTGVTVFATVFLAIAFEPRRALAWYEHLFMPAIILAGLGAWVYVQHVVKRREGFAQAALLGLGIALLIEGACFVAVTHAAVRPVRPSGRPPLTPGGSAVPPQSPVGGG